MLKDTPVELLNSQIDTYRSIIIRLKGRYGIDKDAPQIKLDGLILDYENKIKEFQAAIKILNDSSQHKTAQVQQP